MQGRVETLGSGGDGVIGSDGERWYVPLTAPGDLVEYERQKGTGRNGPNRGRLLSVLESSKDRTTAPCPHFGKCGGCALQHLKHEFTTDWKLQQLREALGRRGFGDVPVTVGLAGAPGRRRRAALTSVRPGNDLPVLGFHERRGKNVVAARQCPVLDPELEVLLPPLREVLTKVQKPRSETRVSVNLTHGGVDLLLDGGLSDGLSVHEALTSFGETHDLARISIADGGEPWTVLERRAPELRWSPLTVVPPPAAFLQADRLAEDYMRSTVTAWATPDAASVDLFCGVGTLTSALPLKSGTLAVDADPAAVKSLREGLDAGQINVRTEVRNLFRRPLQPKELAPFDQAVLDPPAAGAKEQCIELAGSKMNRIIYVSCAPSTFARDARVLCDGGFQLREVRMIDQFYWSTEIELAALLERG